MGSTDDKKALIADYLRAHEIMTAPTSEPPIAQALHRAVVARLTEERAAVVRAHGLLKTAYDALEERITEERDAAQRKAEQVMDGLERAQALATERYQVIQEAAAHLGDATAANALLPSAIDRVVQERDAAQAEVAKFTEERVRAFKALEDKESMRDRIWEAARVLTVAIDAEGLMDVVTLARRAAEQLSRLTEARDAAQREAGALRDALERERARAHDQWVVIHETASHVGTHNLSDALLPRKVAELVRDRDDALHAKCRAQDAWESTQDRIVAAERVLATAIGGAGSQDVGELAEMAAERLKQMTQKRDAARAALAAESKRLSYIERMWTEACALLRDCCPCDVGRSHLTQGLPRLAARAEQLERERDEARKEAQQVEGLRYAVDLHQHERDAALARLRAVAQTLIAAVGAEGPCNAEAAAERIVARLAGVEVDRDAARATVAELNRAIEGDLPRLRWQAGRYEDLCVRLDRARGDDVVANVVATMREAKALRADLERAQREGDPKAWRHEVDVYDPENSRGNHGVVACKVSDIGHADRGVLLEPEVPLVERRHLDAALDRLADVEARHAAAIELARKHCGPLLYVETEEAYITQGIPALAQARDAERAEGVASGRAAAVVEAVELLERGGRPRRG